ncbi:hypothetical protein ALQ93_200268 [Pseudomonas syringae pv. pisi]|uniref:Uncharacterized protein n=2 Tax=Pseudomonas syringae group TaxID=136849 RepID=A0AB38EN74_9PSED|nr:MULTISPECIES: hypothetical protein [Pseudomonas syringae group]RMU70409.1 hypothetical protein ALP24_200076 [Pseudomonas syringae pv. aptata]OSR69182.1 hypothetical protein BV327_04149 [Pseudomonas syringae pv. actinidiae]RML57136.1 hypothetical protein ALQ93_200268 [Pseudomonas syringae pv. pisi]RMM29919.1 hypothetical protein ALQ81_200130 [Pseudomonas syringae pv. pisi]RMM70696.1 hypothetical protein ALQ72_200005 [Pseudomonas syringae pv. maculicola]
MSAIDPDTSEEPIPERRPNSGTGSKVVFIGSDLYSVVTQHAIAVSYATGTQVSAAKFTQYLVEKYGENGVQSLSEFIVSQSKT